MKAWMIHVLSFLLVILLVATSVGCGAAGDARAGSEDPPAEEGESDAETASEDGEDGEKKDEEGEDDEDKEEAVPVEVTEIGVGDIESVLRYSTNLEAESHVQVFSQAARLVTALLVEEGDRVRKNQVLVRLQDDEQRSAMSKVKSELEKARREYDRQKRLFSRT